MKITKTCVLIVCLWAGAYLTKATAQVDLTVNPLGILFGNLSLGADFAVAESFSIEPFIAYRSGSDSEYNQKYTSIPVSAFAKYYLGPKNGTDRFYLGAFLRFVSRKYTADDGGSAYAEYTQSRFGVGFGLGYKVVSVKGLVFDINFGVGRAFVDNTKFATEGDQVIINWPDVMVIGKLGLGYRFGGK